MESSQQRRDREREALLARAGGKDLPASARPAADGSSGRASPTGVQNGLAGVGRTMAESRNRVAERGEKIADLAVKSERMNNAAADFARTAAALRKQQEGSNWFR